MEAGQPSQGRRREITRRFAVVVIAAAVGLAATSVAPAPAGAEVRLAFENTKPAQLFWGSGERMRYRFEVAGQRKRKVRVVAVHGPSGDAVKRWSREAQPGSRETIAWRGFSNGKPAPAGRYFFRVHDTSNGTRASREGSNGTRRSALRHHRFPVPRKVDWGDGWGAGRGHKGQDLFASCGAPVLAARAGRVTWKRYQGGGAGYYVVIRGARNNRDYVYMHLKKRRPVRVGERVNSGQRIGSVGATGNASGCHLHFELWRGRWYDGGRALPSVTRALRRWNRWG